MKYLREGVWPMRPLLLGLSTLGLWLGATLPASAAWDNVFQPTLFGRCRRPATVSQYYTPTVVQASPVCNTCNSPPPQQACSTSYIQRCYYQPVTSYTTLSYYEPVTMYQTSY